MAVDRVRRDELAAAFASFLRNELCEIEFEKTIAPIREAAWHSSCGDKFVNELTNRPVWPSKRKKTLERSTWERARRELTYLLSNLEPRPLPWPSRNGSDEEFPSPRQARLELLCLLIGVELAFIWYWWIFFVFCAVSFFKWQVSQMLMDARWRRATKETLDEILNWIPFANEDEWRAYHHLIDGHNIPQYDDVAESWNTEYSVVVEVLAFPLDVLAWIFVVAFLFLISAFSSMTWLIFLVYAAFKRTNCREN